MANPWFRLYSEFATDPKVQMMSEANQRRLIMLLCMKCCNGDVTLQDEEVAFQLRISNDEWAESKALFVSKNIIDNDNHPVAWDKRQFASDSSAPRVAKHRAKLKEACNVTVTPPEQNRTEQIQKKETTPTTPTGFAEFWQAYPNKTGKGAAETAWKKHRPNLLIVLPALQNQMRSDKWTKDGGQYIPNPATWINQKRWEDGAATPPANNGPKVGDKKMINGAMQTFYAGGVWGL